MSRVSAYPNIHNLEIEKLKTRLITLCATALIALGALTPIGESIADGVAHVVKTITRQADPVEKVELLFPVNGETVDILKPTVVNYIDAMHTQAEPIEDDQVLHDFYVIISFI